ncbi:hypothetical protein KW795_02685 [Candidatus Microgenomates bacterium]|nr:hypothetical protein [Candidatus Microgenomates bacterium]
MVDRDFKREKLLRNVQIDQTFYPFSEEVGYRGDHESPIFYLFEGSNRIAKLGVELETDPKKGGVELQRDVALLNNWEIVRLEELSRQLVSLQVYLNYEKPLSNTNEAYRCSIVVDDILLFGVEDADIVKEISHFSKWRTPNRCVRIVALNLFDTELLQKIKIKIEK